MVVPDILYDPVARAHLLVTGPVQVRFYAATPMTTGDGHHLGIVDVRCTKPRRITADQATALTGLAAPVVDELELRLSARRMLRRERLLHSGLRHPRPRSRGRFRPHLRRRRPPPCPPPSPEAAASRSTTCGPPAATGPTGPSPGPSR
ncbi:hypothetical protein ACIBL8_47025 [Streptomyces sp. NPDC050523]|uniref:hypothetical protein n=1 Tax=Streptomyces sp. NPDC050523 TaxID=3365622 RepID=UPI003796D60D